MTALLSESRPVARKPHRCDAFAWVMESYEDGIFSYRELREIVRMRRQHGMIQPGQRYIRQSQIFDGELCTFKANPEMDAICRSHGLYPDE